MEQKTNYEMDAIDQGQQREIIKLQEENKRQDSLHKIAIGFSVIMITVFILSLVLSASREIVCPHEDCPHYLINQK